MGLSNYLSLSICLTLGIQSCKSCLLWGPKYGGITYLGYLDPQGCIPTYSSLAGLTQVTQAVVL